MFLVCWQLFLLPTVTLGVDCALDCFTGMTKRSHEFVIKEEIKAVNISKVREQAPLFSSNFAHG